MPVPRAVLLVAVAAAVVAAAAPAASANSVEDYLVDRNGSRGDVAAAGIGQPQPAPAAPPAKARRNRPYGFAERNQLELVTPVPRPVYVGFHESFSGAAVRLRPLGKAEVIDNRRRPPPPRGEGMPYGILRTRGRGPSPTSAVDVQVRHNEPIRAVVTGTVVQARKYRLYGRYPDSMVVIRPDDASRKLVTMLHVKGLRVRKGQRVEAGKTFVAKRASSFPFSSQIDRYSGKRLPHVHVEVHRR